jgi:hypothetical protein
MKLLVPIAALALTGCATVPPTNAEPVAGVGQSAYVNGLHVRPLKVVEDSRCPINAVCIWAGRIIVTTEVSGGSWKEVRDLELGKPQQIADGALTLVEAQPQKNAGAEADPRAYRFKFDFQGGL